MLRRIDGLLFEMIPHQPEVLEDGQAKVVYCCSKLGLVTTLDDFLCSEYPLDVFENFRHNLAKFVDLPYNTYLYGVGEKWL